MIIQCELKKYLALTMIILFSGFIMGGVQRVVAEGNPQLSVHTNENAIFAFDWLVPDTIVSVTIENPGNPGQPTYTSTMIWEPNGGYYYLQLGDSITLQAGQVVTITDGATTKSITIIPFAVTDMDVNTERIFGQTAQDAVAVVDIGYNQNMIRTTHADSDGNWSVDFSTLSGPSDQGIYNLRYGAYGQAYTYDEDGDTVQVSWRAGYPRFEVRANVDQVRGWNWTYGETVNLNVCNQVFRNTVGATTWDDNESYIEFNLSGSCDIKPGDYVSLMDGMITKDTWVTGLELTRFDVINDTVSGKAAPYSNVDL
jgi:hypothetical protein